MQITAIRGAQRYFGDRLFRTAKPHKHSLGSRSVSTSSHAKHWADYRLISKAECSVPTASLCRDCMPPGRLLDSGAEEITATARSKALSWGAASSPVAPPDGPPLNRSDDSELSRPPAYFRRSPKLTRADARMDARSR